MNTPQVDRRINLFAIPFSEVFYTLKYCVIEINPRVIVDWHEYVLCVVRYIFEEDRGFTPELKNTPCRTILGNVGFTIEQITWVEHNVISMAISLIGDAHSYIKMQSSRNKIEGFNWNIDENNDLLIQLMYK